MCEDEEVKSWALPTQHETASSVYFLLAASPPTICSLPSSTPRLPHLSGISTLYIFVSSYQIAWHHLWYGEQTSKRGGKMYKSRVKSRMCFFLNKKKKYTKPCFEWKGYKVHCRGHVTKSRHEKNGNWKSVYKGEVQAWQRKGCTVVSLKRRQS